MFVLCVDERRVGAARANSYQFEYIYIYPIIGTYMRGTLYYF